MNIGDFVTLGMRVCTSLQHVHTIPSNRRGVRTTREGICTPFVPDFCEEFARCGSIPLIPVFVTFTEKRLTYSKNHVSSLHFWLHGILNLARSHAPPQSKVDLDPGNVYAEGNVCTSSTSKAAVCLAVAVAIAFPTWLSSQQQEKLNQQGKQPAKGNPTSPPPSVSSPSTPGGPAASEAQNPTTAQSSLAKLAATVTTSAPELQGDYIPCKFTVAELRALVSPDVAPTLTAADEELLKQRVISAATSSIDDRSLQITDLNEFIKQLAADNLSGLTPAQALNRIIQDLASSRAAVTTPEDVAALQRSLENATPSTVRTTIQNFMTYLGPLTVGTVPKSQLPTTAANQFQSWAKGNQANAPSAQDISEVSKALSAIQPADTSTIVDAARNTIALLERPPDVGCAMSILTYKETDEAYGHLISNTYIAVQVVVRNLSRDQSFVLHDVEFEVNADPTGRLGRFFSGRDKVVVRALSAAQSSFDPRAIFVHSAQGIGAILSATVPIFGNTSLTNATAVFNGGFVPGLDKYWKDQTADQLNLLNDTGFSSQASSQTAVPVSGTVMFVTFIPSKPLEEGWWTQQCVEKTYLGTTDENGFVSNLAIGDHESKPIRQESGSSQQMASRTSHNEQTGVDVARALEICTLSTDPLPRKNWKSDHAVAEVSNQDSQLNQVHHMGNVDLFRNAYPSPYKKWSPNSLAIFRELSNVVVSGTHIVEDTQLAPSVSALSCATDDTGNLIFPKPDKDTISCPIIGKNLDKVAKLRLRNAKDAADTSAAEGTVSVSGDSNNGTVVFQTAALHSLPQTAYAVFAVSIKGVEQKTSQTIHLSVDPYVSGVTPKTVDFSSGTAVSQSLTISGNHLATVDTVLFANPDGTKKAQITLKVDALKTDTKLLVPLDPSTLTDFGTTKTTLTLTLEVGTKTYETGQQFDFTGATVAAKEKAKVKPAPLKNKASTPAARGTPTH
jgi:hypothetical protein